MTFFTKIIQAIYLSNLCLISYSMFVLPLKIWLSSLEFLNNQCKEGNAIRRYSASEMKVLSWIPLFLNSLIFLAYLIGLGLIISLFFKGFTPNKIWNKFLIILITSYFSPIMLSLLKELVSIRLLTYFKLEEIADNTEKKQ